MCVLQYLTVFEEERSIDLSVFMKEFVMSWMGQFSHNGMKCLQLC